MTPQLEQLERLWALLPHPDEQTVVRWFARSGNMKVGDYAADVSELAMAVVAYPDLQFYVQPNPTTVRTGVKCSAKDISHWSWFLVDVDPIGPGPHAPRAAAEEVLASAQEWFGKDFSRRRPLMIDSGRGVQIWIRLDDRLLIDAGDAPRGAYERPIPRRAQAYWLERLNTIIKPEHGCHVDTSCSDLPRVMRCPGTVNQKTGRMAEFIEPSAHVFAGLADILVNGTPPERLTQPEVVALPEGMPWQVVYPVLTFTARKFIDHGAEEPGRHKTVFATARALFDRGLTMTAVLEACRLGNGRSSDPLPDSEIQRTVGSAARG